ncbi:MAG: hypothetical protein M3157_07090 [Actinomycetota bacterium]|nr:hypothetical protein [Actinomycetota bacterium]
MKKLVVSLLIAGFTALLLASLAVAKAGEAEFKADLASLNGSGRAGRRS